MKLLVILLCLVSERYLIHVWSFSRFQWLGAYFQWLEEQSFAKSLLSIPWVGLFACISPFLLLGTLIQWVIADLLYGVLNLLFHIIIFYYCLGPKNPFYPEENLINGEDHTHQVVDYFYMINRQLFAPIFWYVLTGPIGVLFYRMITLCQSFSPVRSQAEIFTDILEWIPIRILSLLFLLTGNFQRGYASFKNRFFSGITQNRIFIADSGLEALRTDKEEVLSVTLAESLVMRALIVILVILAICTNIAWMS